MPYPAYLTVEQRRANKWAQVKRWRLTHPEMVAAQRARSNDARRGKPQAPGHKESVRKWNEVNREHYLLIKRVLQQKRRAQLRGASGTCTVVQVLDRFAYFGNKCWMCRSEGKLAIDHVKPVTLGGSNWPSNIRPACRSCNSRKGAKHWKEVMRYVYVRSLSSTG